MDSQNYRCLKTSPTSGNYSLLRQGIYKSDFFPALATRPPPVLLGHPTAIEARDSSSASRPSSTVKSFWLRAPKAACDGTEANRRTRGRWRRGRTLGRRRRERHGKGRTVPNGSDAVRSYFSVSKSVDFWQTWTWRV